MTTLSQPEYCNIQNILHPTLLEGPSSLSRYLPALSKGEETEVLGLLQVEAPGIGTSPHFPDEATSCCYVREAESDKGTSMQPA